MSTEAECPEIGRSELERPEIDEEPKRWVIAIWIGWTALWLVLLIPAAIEVLSRGDARGRFAFGCFVIGALAYGRACFLGFAPTTALRTTRLGIELCLVGLVATVLATSAVGDPGLGLMPYVAVSLVASLPQRFALPLVALGVLVANLVTQAHPDWAPIQGLSFGTAVATLGTSMGRWSVRRDLVARDLRRRAHEAEIQDERNRMARDLHDILGHSLTVISLKADLAGKLVDRDPAAAKRELGELQSLARSALADVRATVNNYREISLAGELVRARQALRDAGVRAELPTTVDDVDPELRELFAWSLREAVTNVVRHAGASSCLVTLTRDTLTVRDDGRGTRGADGCGVPGGLAGREGLPGREGGHGLEGLRERAARAGAVVETSSGDATNPSRPGFVLTVREAL